MYIMINGRKINIVECVLFRDKLKSFRFYLDKIDYGKKLCNKKIANTYLFCQKIDICFTDNDNKIIALYSDVKSEKIIYKSKAKNIYYLPIGSCCKLKVGEIINEKKKN